MWVQLFSFLGISLATLTAASASTSQTSGDRLFAGIASRDITPAIGVPLGGYFQRRGIFPDGDPGPATFFKASTGTLDRIRSKALILKSGDRQLLFVSVDLVGVSSIVRDALINALRPMGFGEDSVFISATHTHSGPGTVANNSFWEQVAMDRFQVLIYNAFFSGILASVRDAYVALRPAELETLSFDPVGLQKNRRVTEGPVYPTARLLLVRDPGGAFRGVLANWAVHGTALGPENLHFSADVPGAIERALQTRLEGINQAMGDRSRVSVLFINGILGDVAPIRDGTAGMQFVGEAFARAAVNSLSSARKLEPSWQVSSKEVELGNPFLNLRNCARQFADPLKIIFGSSSSIALKRWLPLKTRLWQIRLGDQTFVTWPGEPTVAVGTELFRMLGNRVSRDVWVLGLTNEYLAYFTSPREYAEKSYEACFSLYGSNGGALLIQGYRDLFDRNPSH